MLKAGESVSFLTGVSTFCRPHFTMQYGSAPGSRGGREGGKEGGGEGGKEGGGEGG